MLALIALIALAALGCRTAPTHHDTGWGTFEEMDIVGSAALDPLDGAALDCALGGQRPDHEAKCATPRTCLEHLTRRPDAQDGVYVIDPDGTGLIFTTTLGQIVLSGVILCVFAAGRMAQKILSSEL